MVDIVPGVLVSDQDLGGQLNGPGFEVQAVVGDLTHAELPGVLVDDQGSGVVNVQDHQLHISWREEEELFYFYIYNCFNSILILQNKRRLEKIVLSLYVN